MNTETSAVTHHANFGRTPSGTPLFAVQPGIPLHEALEQIAMTLGNASLLCGETVDADIQTGRSMNQIIAQLVDASRGLVDATLEGLNHSGQSAASDEVGLCTGR
jgi:hypothetical protein